MLNKSYPLAASCLALLLCACGSSSNSTTSQERTVTQPGATNVVTTEQGRFLDSAVQGLNFSTETLSGVTDSNGTFSYIEGETVVFSIGSLTFPTIAASSVITPVDYAAGKQNPESFTLNMARLLQSLDLDGNPENGIVIPDSAALGFSDINLDIPTSEFESNPSVINLVANSGSLTSALVDSTLATNHLLATIASLQETSANALDDVIGYWSDPTNGDYTLITDTGSIAFYDNQPVQSCFTVRMGTIESVDGTLYQLETDDGISQPLIITRTGDTMNILLLGSLSLVTDSTPTDLQLCTQ